MNVNQIIGEQRISDTPDDPAPYRRVFKNSVPARFVLKIQPSTGFS